MQPLRLEINERFYLSPAGLTAHGAEPEADAAACAHWCNAPDIAANTLTMPYPYTLDDGRAFMQVLQQAYLDHGRPLAMAIREAGGAQALVGMIGLEHGAAGSVGRVAIGYWLGVPYRGQSLMSQAVQVYTRHLFAEGAYRVAAHVFRSNGASGRVLERAGFTYEGILKGHVEKEGVLRDVLSYARLNPARKRHTDDLAAEQAVQ